MQHKEKITAIALMSTGLDSLLAARIVRNLGVEVHGVCYYYQFDGLADKYQQGEVDRIIGNAGIPVTAVDISEEFLPIFLDPPHGYGSGINPCIDCHLFMFAKAKIMMDEMRARFLVTGEVVGQRPMSQNKPTLFHIDKVSGLRGLILRPLCAKLMPVTVSESKGWVDREKLYDFNGRTRTPQLKLASELGITEYPDPAGGCILTEPNFSRRVKAFIKNQGKENVTVEALKLHRFGRHFWPRKNFHVIVGRDESDNLALEPFRLNRWVFEALHFPGPLVLAEGIEDKEDLLLVASITARYCRCKGSSQVLVSYYSNKEKGEINVEPADSTTIQKWQV